MGKYRHRLEISVRTNARKETLLETATGWQAAVKGKPIAGQANERLLRLVSKRFRVPREQVTIIRGTRSRHKTVGILSQQ